MYDTSGNAIPIRWLAPECVELSNDAFASLQSITKECNLWLVDSVDFNTHTCQCVCFHFQFETTTFVDI